MAKKDVNVFSVSFLDLLAGALAAVIILFVVVPKMAVEHTEVVETMERLDVQVEQLDSLLQLAMSSVPAELYEEITRQMDDLRETIDALRTRVIEIENELNDCEESLREMREELERVQQRLDELTSQSREGVVDRATGPGQTMYGVDASFSIVIAWHENLDVDLHIVNRQNNQRVWFRNLNSPWGNLLADVRSRSPDEDIFELFYQKDVVPGTYDIYYHLYTNTSSPVTVEGYVVIFPFTVDEYKVDIPSRIIRHAQNVVKVGTVVLTSNGFTFQNQ